MIWSFIVILSGGLGQFGDAGQLLHLFLNSLIVSSIFVKRLAMYQTNYKRIHRQRLPHQAKRAVVSVIALDPLPRKLIVPAAPDAKLLAIIGW
jgi:hypothetical protein